MQNLFNKFTKLNEFNNTISPERVLDSINDILNDDALYGAENNLRVNYDSNNIILTILMESSFDGIEASFPLEQNIIETITTNIQHLFYALQSDYGVRLESVHIDGNILTVRYEEFTDNGYEDPYYVRGINRDNFY